MNSKAMCESTSGMEQSGEAIAYQRKVARTFTWCMRSKRFAGVFNVFVSWIALALFTSTSMPPKCFAAAATALEIDSSERTSRTRANAFPPAASTASTYHIRLVNFQIIALIQKTEHYGEKRLYKILKVENTVNLLRYYSRMMR